VTGEARPIEIAVCVSPSRDQAGRPAWQPSLGELDVRAVELAWRLAQAPDAHTTAVSVGPAEATSRVLTDCLARGISSALHVGDDWVEDALGVAACIAEALRPLSPDLVICGQRSAVGGYGVVPTALADRLGLPVVSNVVRLDVDWAERKARATQMLERGARWHWGTALPMICAVERDAVVPRYLALRRLARARAAGQVASASSRVAGLFAEIEQEFGVHAAAARGPARIRTKKTKAPPKQMSAADRMKFLRGAAPTGSSSDDNGPRKFSGSARQAAQEILQLLEQEELV
jgi:electron transfer flavoprotein alpha/beta subunit